MDTAFAKTTTCRWFWELLLLFFLTYYVGMSQWTKLIPTTTFQNQINSQVSRHQLVKLAQSGLKRPNWYVWRRLGSIVEMIIETEVFFSTKDKSSYQKDIKMLEKHWTESITLGGNYVDGLSWISPKSCCFIVYATNSSANVLIKSLIVRCFLNKLQSMEYRLRMFINISGKKPRCQINWRP